MWRICGIAVVLMGCLSTPPRPHDDRDGPVADARVPDGAIDAGALADGTPPTPDAVPGCPATYGITITGSTSSYRLAPTMVTWPTAASDCADDDAVAGPPYTHLAVLASDAERVQLHTALDTMMWIGLTDQASEDAWVWVTAENPGYGTTIVDPPWPSGGQPDDQPDTDGTGADCATMSSTSVDGFFYDQSCLGTAAQALCECDGSP